MHWVPHGPRRESRPRGAGDEMAKASDLEVDIVTYVSNRFLLTGVAAKVTRRFHRPNTRIQDTVNEVLERFSRVNPLAGVPYTGNLQSFPRAVQGETHASYEDLEQSVA
jgi:hypothetical protein